MCVYLYIYTYMYNALNIDPIQYIEMISTQRLGLAKAQVRGLQVLRRQRNGSLSQRQHAAAAAVVPQAFDPGLATCGEAMDYNQRCYSVNINS